MVCHWPGIYCNGTREGLRIFQTVVERLHARYDHLLWLKPSEIARYEAARQLTAIHKDEAGVRLKAPFATSRFTLRTTAATGVRQVVVHREGVAAPEHLREVPERLALSEGCWCRVGEELIVCFALEVGSTRLQLTA